MQHVNSGQVRIWSMHHSVWSQSVLKCAALQADVFLQSSKWGGTSRQLSNRAVVLNQKALASNGHLVATCRLSQQPHQAPDASYIPAALWVLGGNTVYDCSKQGEWGRKVGGRQKKRKCSGRQQNLTNGPSSLAGKDASNRQPKENLSLGDYSGHWNLCLLII